MKLQNKVVCFVGPSGVGKTSFSNRLAKKYGFALPIVVTTRKKRVDDNNHFRYVDEDTFFEMRDMDLFIEWDKYSYYYYGTLLQSIKEHRDNGIILDLTPDGCKKVVKAIPTAIVIALLPDDPKWLFDRLIGRDSQSRYEIETRTGLLQNYLSEIHLLNCKKVHVGFSPDSWDKTFEMIENIVFEGG